MPSNKTRNTLARQWELLKLLPSRGAGKSAKEIADALAEAGFAVSKRQVERDLLDLQEVFGLECNDVSIPYGWRWGAAPIELPGVTLAEALSLQIVEETLKPLLPASVLRTVQPRFAQAKAKLAALKEQNKAASWADKVASVPPTMQMLPPVIDEEILETVQTALLNEEQVDVCYQTLSDESKELRLHPLGLVVRGAATYLVATAFDYTDVRLYALHRFKSADRTYEPAKQPKGFKLSQYVDEGGLQFGKGQVLKLVAKIDGSLAKHLAETPLSANQKIKAVDTGFELSASVVDSWQLHWWILSHGNAIEIVLPGALRERTMASLKSALNHYVSE
jgi:predicted DNA-binding transcriptional regulator YafY